VAGRGVEIKKGRERGRKKKEERERMNGREGRKEGQVGAEDTHRRTSVYVNC